MSDQEQRILQILERCFAEMESGREPDLVNLCDGDAELQARVVRLIALERESLRLASGESPDRSVPVPIGIPGRIGDFTPLEPIGVGGMSRVYRARQESLDRDVALKILREDLVATPAGRLRFHREATITAALDHPNIAPVYAAGEAGGQVYLAMKLLRGQSLEQMSKPIGPEVVARFGLEVALALQSAHEIGVVHRDVKPANVMVEKGVAYMVDFGLSSFIHGAGSITKPDSTPGTLSYLAPELARRSGGGLDPRIDVYGLGATLYEALSGRPPFESSTPIHLLHQVLHRDPPALQLPGRLGDLETIVMKAMEKEPSRRFQTAAALGDELQRFLDGRPIRSRPIGPIERLGRHIRRRPVTSSLVGTILLLLVGLVAVLVKGEIARQRRLERGIAMATVAIAEGRIDDAEQDLDEIKDLQPASALVDPLRSDIELGRLVLALTALLQTPVSHQAPQLLRSLTDHIGSVSELASRSRVGEVAVAVASRLLDPNPVAHSSLTDATRSEWPRASAAIGAWSSGRSVQGALKDVPLRSGAWDHYFAALALRLSRARFSEVEIELRAARAQGAAADAIQHSLVWALEAQGQSPTVEARIARLRAAYDLSLRLRESRGYGVIAEFHCARLSVLLDDIEAAKAHLQAARRVHDQDTHLQSLFGLSELEVLKSVDENAFWSRWRELRTVCESLPQFWLLAGYGELARTGASLDPDREQRAKAYFDRGLTLAPLPAARAVLELAMIELEWMACVGLESSESARKRRLALVAKAEDFARAAAASTLTKDFRESALFVAAKTSFDAGERQRGWLTLELICRDSSHPDVLSFYSVSAAERIFFSHLDGAGGLRSWQAEAADSDTDIAAPLLEVAAKAVLRARTVIASLAETKSENSVALHNARIGLLVGSFHLGEPGESLPLAVEWSVAAPDDALRPLVDCCLSDGGFRADQWLPTTGPVTPRLAAMLSESVATMQALHERKALTRDQVAAALARWRRCTPLVATVGATDEPWLSLWRDIAALETQLRDAK